MAVTVHLGGRRLGKTHALNEALKDWRLTPEEGDGPLNETETLEPLTGKSVELEITDVDPEVRAIVTGQPRFHPRMFLERLQLAMHNPMGKFAQSNSAIGRQTMYEGTVASHVVAKRRAKNKAAAKARRVHRKAAR